MSLSTGVDKKTRRPKLPAAQTRERVLAVARRLFCQSGFDNLGVRELAGAAAVDPAIVIRLFGSKEKLFAEIADGAFALEEPFEGPAQGMGNRIAAFLTGKSDATAAADEEFDDFRFLLLSAVSPVAAPILSKALHRGFIEPLSRQLKGEQAAVRAALLCSCVLGFVTLRVGLGSTPLDKAPRKQLAIALGRVLQACIDDT
jgi:AcrR family transcriptional regulator